MQLYADIYLLLKCSMCFGRPLHPSSGVHKTAVAASGTNHTIWGASFLKHNQIIFLCFADCACLLFISVINQLDAQNFFFTISLFHASTCFEHVLETCRGMK